MKTFALFCEDDQAEVHLRLNDIARGEGVGFADLDGVGWCARSGLENVLMTFGQQEHVGRATPLWSALRDEIKAFGAQLVIIDTLADAFGGNENFRSQARSFIGQLRGLANAINGAVVLTAHPSVAGQVSGTGLSGSTAWNNSVRSRLYLTRPPADDADRDDRSRVLKRLKANYAGAGDQIKLRYADGVLVADTAPSLEWMTHDRADAAFIAALRALKAEGRAVSHSPSANFAPKVMAGRPETKGFNKIDLTKAMNRLLQTRRIRANMEVGRKANRHQLIGLGEVAASDAPDVGGTA
jgi:RecA-family ATPase